MHHHMPASSSNLPHLLLELSRSILWLPKAQMKIQQPWNHKVTWVIVQGHRRERKVHRNRVHKIKRERKLLQKSSRVNCRRPESIRPWIQTQTMKNLKMIPQLLQILNPLYQYYLFLNDQHVSPKGTGKGSGKGSRKCKGKGKSRTSATCLCCGKEGHKKADCKLKTVTCSKCGKIGYLRAVCRNTNTHEIETDIDEPSPEVTVEAVWCTNVQNIAENGYNEKHRGSSVHRDGSKLEKSSRTSRLIKSSGKIIPNIEMDQKCGKVIANIETDQILGKFVKIVETASLNNQRSSRRSRWMTLQSGEISSEQDACQVII